MSKMSNSKPITNQSHETDKKRYTIYYALLFMNISSN